MKGLLRPPGGLASSILSLIIQFRKSLNYQLAHLDFHRESRGFLQGVS